MSSKSTRAKNRKRHQQRSQTVRLRSVPSFPEARDEPAGVAVLVEDSAGHRVYVPSTPIEQAEEIAGRFHDTRHDRDQVHQGITATLAATQRAIHRSAIERRALDVAGECMEDRDLTGALSVLASAARRLDRLDASAPARISA